MSKTFDSPNKSFILTSKVEEELNLLVILKNKGFF